MAISYGRTVLSVSAVPNHRIFYVGGFNPFGNGQSQLGGAQNTGLPGLGRRQTLTEFSPLNKPVVHIA